MEIKKLLTFLLLLTSTIFAQTKSEQIDDLLSRYNEYGLLNASVLVAEKGEVIFKKGYGYANIEFNIANNEKTVHRIGSITKQFVSMMIMQLVDEGKINIEEKMTSYLKNYRKDTGDKVTIFHLLTHTSGIPSYTGLPNFWADSMKNPYSTDELIEKFCSGDLEFEPGSKFAYNNSGYVLLAKIVEEVTGKSYEDNIQERIFNKVGMKNSFLDRSEKIILNRAPGYDKRGNNLLNTKYMNVKNAFGAGDMVSTVEDLYLWDQALYTDNLISNESKKKIFTPFLSNYGFGWGISKIENPVGGDSLTLILHTGGINGFNALIARLVDDKHLIVVLNNSGGAPLGEIRRNITNILYGKDYEFPKKPIANHLHQIILDEGIDKAMVVFKEIMEFEKETFDINENEMNNLGYSLIGEDKIDEAIGVFQLNIDTFPKSSNVYDSMGEALMKKGENEKAIENYKKSVELNPQNTNGFEMLKKLGVDISTPKDAEVSKEILKNYTGTYNLLPNFNVVISKEEGKLFAQASGQPKFQIFPETVSKFYYKVVAAKIEFITENDKVNSLVLYQGGREMPGTRVEE